MKSKRENTLVTTTTTGSILKEDDLKTFESAVLVWEQETKNTVKALEIMAQIGKAINLLYAKGAEKEVKRTILADIVRNAFPGLDRRERSDYRKIANVFTEIKCFTEFAGIKSLNPTYLLNAWRTAVKEDQEAMAKIEKELKAQKAGLIDIRGGAISEVILRKQNKVDGIDEVGEVGEGVYTNPLDAALKAMGEKEDTVFSDIPIKSGYDNIVRPVPLTGEEVVKNVYAATNQAITYFNEGRLTSDDLTALEMQLMRTLQHINEVKQDGSQEYPSKLVECA